MKKKNFSNAAFESFEKENYFHQFSRITRGEKKGSSMLHFRIRNAIKEKQKLKSWGEKKKKFQAKLSHWTVFWSHIACSFPRLFFHDDDDWVHMTFKFLNYPSRYKQDLLCIKSSLYSCTWPIWIYHLVDNPISFTRSRGGIQINFICSVSTACSFTGPFLSVT